MLNLSPEYTPVRIAINVIPICAADKKTSGVLERSKALFAASSPFEAMLSSLPLRADTNAISLITNKPFNKIRPSKMIISIYEKLVSCSKLANPNRLLKKEPSNNPYTKPMTAPPKTSKG